MNFVITIACFSAYCLNDKLANNSQFNLILGNFVQNFLSDAHITIYDTQGFLPLNQLQLQLPISIINRKYSNTSYYFEEKLDTTSNYIIFCDEPSVKTSLENLELVLISLKTHISWNPHAKYLIVVKHRLDITPTLALFWKHNMYNVVVAVTDEQSFYTWYPYEVQNNCGKTIMAHKVSSFESLNPFTNKVPKQLNRCPLMVSWYKSDYLIHDPEDEIPAATNYFYKSLGESSNLSIIYKNKVIYYNEILKGSMETQDLDMKNKEIDVAIFGSFSSATYLKYDLSDTVIEILLRWILPQPKRIPHWKSMIVVFRIETWIAILLTLIITSVVWWVFSFALEKRTSIAASSIIILKIFLGISTPQLSDQYAHKVLAIFSYFVSMTIIVGYLSMMSSVLIYPLYEPKVANVKDMARANLKLKFLDVMFEEIAFDLDQETRNLIQLKHVSTTLQPADELQAFLTDPTYAAIVSDVVMNKLKEPAMVEELVVQGFPPIRLIFLLPKGHPLTHRLNYMLRLCHETGLFKQWMQNSYIKSEKWEVTIEAPNESALTIKDLQLGFYVLLIGLSISAAVFIYELLILKFRQQVAIE